MSQPTTDTQLDEFLFKWEQTRAGFVAKYTRRADQYRALPHMSVSYHAAKKRLEFHQHELDMLTELRNRAFRRPLV